MTTAPQPPEAHRAPPTILITANLLPEEIIEARRGRKVRRIVVAALAAFTVIVAAWYGLATLQTANAQAELYSSQAQVRDLTRQQNDFAEVVAARAGSDAIRAQLAGALAGDLSWSRLLIDLQKVAPAGVQVTAVSGTVTPLAPGAPVSSASPAPAALPAAAPPIGTLTVTGVGINKLVVAAYVDALGMVKGLSNPYLGSATIQEGKLRFIVRLDITPAALGGRYTMPSGNPS
jgi:Tfp pilus assembly protein PilN